MELEFKLLQVWGLWYRIKYWHILMVEYFFVDVWGILTGHFFNGKILNKLVHEFLASYPMLTRLVIDLFLYLKEHKVKKLPLILFD